MGDQALTYVDHLVRAVYAQPRHPVLPHCELHSRPPAQAACRPCLLTLLVAGLLVAGLLVSGQGLDGDLAVDTGQPPELLPDHRGLERSLSGQGSVLPVAAAAGTGTGMRARWLDPVR